MKIIRNKNPIIPKTQFWKICGEAVFSYALWRHVSAIVGTTWQEIYMLMCLNLDPEILF